MLYEAEVRKQLGDKVVDCLLEAVDHGHLSLQETKDIAQGLHSTVGGNFLRDSHLPNFRFDKTRFRQILCDWFLHDDENGKSGVTLEKLRMVLVDIGLQLRVSGDAVKLSGILSEQETKRLIGEQAWTSLLDAFDVGAITQAQAQFIATKLNPCTGGWFKRAQDTPNFKFDRPVFKRIFMDWVARTEEDKLVSIKVIQKVLEDPDICLKMEEMQNGTFEVRAIFWAGKKTSNCVNMRKVKVKWMILTALLTLAVQAQKPNGQKTKRRTTLGEGNYLAFSYFWKRRRKN